jgi:Predicted transcriptional regulators containing the CopG/Arc/MetJ DNA-binding domain
MRNVVPMITVSIRIPEELVNKIDDAILTNGAFSNRTDLIIYAIRHEWNKIVIESCHTSADELKSFNEDKVKWIVVDVLSKMNKNYSLEYSRYGGKPKQILLRLPEGMINYMMGSLRGDEKIETAQNLIRLLIAGYFADSVNVFINRKKEKPNNNHTLE